MEPFTCGSDEKEPRTFTKKSSKGSVTQWTYKVNCGSKADSQSLLCEKAKRTIREDAGDSLSCLMNLSPTVVKVIVEYNRSQTSSTEGRELIFSCKKK